MKVHFYRPVHPVLRQYIEGYYFISSDQPTQSVRYLTFPYNYFIVSGCQNARVIQKGNSIEIYHSDTQNIIIDLVTRCSTSTEIYYDQPVNEITFYFKPLGIYHFYDQQNSSLLEDEILFSDLNQIMTSVLNESDRKIQIEKLESYWLSKFKGKDLRQIEKIVSDLESDLKIEEIARKNNITRQYVNKISTRYLGKSASEYRKIFRFRNAIIKNKEMKNFTELSYENLFYDQSHFIKDFKDLTKTRPSSFFSQVNTDDCNLWLFI
jgi:AraC-like DNA-binding protein